MGEMKSLTLNDKKYDGFVDPVARTLAYASAVIKSASGESISVSDASDGKPYGLTIYGKTTQNGTPTQDAPVELVSIGNNGSITVNVTGENDAQSMTLVTSNGLPGIPVDSGGNYTDSNGQQWTCDEIDLARGVYVQRVNLTTVNASGTTQFKNGGVGLIVQLNPQKVYQSDVGLFCTHTTFDRERTMDEGTCYENQGNVVICGSTDDTFDSLMEKYGDAKFLYILSTPIETALSAEEISAYNALRTYRDNTTVSNDASAHMELEYAMDAKKYIDSLIVKPVARLSEVTLLASAWTGANSLYSQVVTIDGITEYSKVDLLPSVEQLAIFHNKDLAFVTENEDGVVTVYAIGDKPTNDYTIQVQITEVKV